MRTHSPTSPPFHRPRHFGVRLQLVHWLLMSTVAAFGTAIAQAAETSAAAASALKVLTAPMNEAHSTSGAAPSHSGAAGYSITVQKGESIDAVIRRGLPGLILNEEFMRQALAKANPRIFPKGRTYPVRPGTVLVLPTPETLRQQVLLQYPQTAALFQPSAEPSEASNASTGPDKRRWVRFP